MNNDILVRSASLFDVPELSLVFGDFAEESGELFSPEIRERFALRTINRIYQPDMFLVKIGIRKDKIIGFLTGEFLYQNYTQGKYFEADLLYIVKNERKTFVPHMLYETIFDELRQKGAKKLLFRQLAKNEKHKWGGTLKYLTFEREL